MGLLVKRVVQTAVRYEDTAKNEAAHKLQLLMTFL
jgi:hypothetical protein